MPGSKNLALVLLLLLPASSALAQSGPPQPSSIGRINREVDALERRTAALATLLLSYTSGGELTSSLRKANPQGLFVRAKINGTPIKGLAKGKKRKVAVGIEPGVILMEVSWSRPGTRLKTECQADLQVGFQEVLILPYGGNENFSCEILPRVPAEEILEEWKKGLDADEADVLAGCLESHETLSTGFWSCIDSAGLSFPMG